MILYTIFKGLYVTKSFQCYIIRVDSNCVASTTQSCLVNLSLPTVLKLKPCAKSQGLQPIPLRSTQSCTKF